jgi:hypothetical protein
MRRRILIVVLALGTLFGFGAGFASLRHRGCEYHGGYGRYGRGDFEQRVSELCADAALRAQRGQPLAAPGAR